MEDFANWVHRSCFVNNLDVFSVLFFFFFVLIFFFKMDYPKGILLSSDRWWIWLQMNLLAWPHPFSDFGVQHVTSKQALTLDDVDDLSTSLALPSTDGDALPPPANLIMKSLPCPHTVSNGSIAVLIYTWCCGNVERCGQLWYGSTAMWWGTLSGFKGHVGTLRRSVYCGWSEAWDQTSFLRSGDG